METASGAPVSGGGNKLMALPTDFAALWTPGFNIYRTGYGQYITDLTAASLRPGATGTLQNFYFDPVNGSNANNGTAIGTPKQTNTTTLALTTYDTVVLNYIPPADRIIWGGLNAAQRPLRNAVIQATDGGPLWFVKAAKPTWAVDGTYSNVYSTAAAGTTSSARGAVIDLRPRLVNGEDQVKALTPVADKASVAATAGTYWHDYANSIVYVRAHDDRNLVGDGYMCPPTSTGVNGYFNVEAAMAAPRTFYLSNVYLVGGVPMSATNNATDFAAAYRPVLVMDGGGFIGGTASGNGGAHIYGAYDIFYFNTEAAYNWKDGLNAHVLSPTTGGGFPRVVEIGTKCLWRNGWDGLNLLPVTTNTNNHSTLHETSMAICVMPTYGSNLPTQGSEGRPLHDIDSARRLVFGGTLGVSASMQTVATGANYPSVQAGNSDSHATVMDLYECNVPVGGNTALYSYAGSAIRCHGMEGIFAGLTKGGATANITNVALS